MRTDPGIQRREEVRTRVAVPIELFDADGRSLRTITHNLSAGGALLDWAHELRTGTFLRFVLDLSPHGPIVQGDAEVTRGDELRHRSLQFHGLDHGQRDAIARYVFACERSRLQAWGRRR